MNHFDPIFFSQFNICRRPFLHPDSYRLVISLKRADSFAFRFFLRLFDRFLMWMVNFIICTGWFSISFFSHCIILMVTSIPWKFRFCVLPLSIAHTLWWLQPKLLECFQIDFSLLLHLLEFFNQSFFLHLCFCFDHFTLHQKILFLHFHDLSFHCLLLNFTE